MRIRNFSVDEYYVVPLSDLLNEKNKHKPVLVYESEEQVLDVECNSKEYDYESLIHQIAL